MADDDSPLTMTEAVRAMTQVAPQRNPKEDNSLEPPDDGDRPEDEDEEALAAGLAEEDQDNPEAGDADEGPPEEDAEDEQEPRPKGRFAADDDKVMLEGGKVTTLRELKQGTLLQSDYSRKTAAVAEERKTIEQQKANLAAVENALAQQRELVALLYQRKLPQPPDASMNDPGSANYDFVGYMTQKDAYERESRDLHQLIGQHREMLARQAQEAEQQRRALRDQEAERLFEKLPELKAPGAYAKFWADMVDYVTEVGFTPEELNDVDDHRTYQVVKDAMAYRKLKAKVHGAKAKVNGKPTLLQGSTRRSTEVVRRQDETAALTRLKKTGSLKDGVQALLAREKVR